MSKNVRRRGRWRARKKQGNWFTRMKMWQRALVCFAGVLACLSVSAAVYVAAQWGKIDSREIKAEDLIINQKLGQNAEVDLGEGYTNVALFGVDSRDGNLGKGNRTDCIIVASLNNETKEIKMVSVYRDTLLDLSDGTFQKCNAAYSYGGPVMAINMLNKNLDLDIQDYVTVDFGAIADAIDLLGGVEIEVTEAELPYINQYIPETAASAGKETAYIESAGLQLLDGTQATTYARIRSTAGGDFTRTERQRTVIEKMVEKAKKADLVTINNIINKVFPQVSTSFTLSEILNYALAYSEYTLAGNMGFPVEKSTDTISGFGSIVIPEDLTSNVSKMHDFLFGTTGYQPSSTVTSLSADIDYTVSTAGGSGASSYGSYDEEEYSYGSGDSYDSTYGSDSSWSEEPETPEEPADTQEPEQPDTAPDSGTDDGGSGSDAGGGASGETGQTGGSGGTDTGAEGNGAVE